MLLLIYFSLLSLHFLRGSAWKTLNVPHTPGHDDTPALTALLPQYCTNATIIFQKDVTYNIFTPLVFPQLTNVEVRFEGNLTYPASIPAIQEIVRSNLYPGAWFTFKGGNNVTVRGSVDAGCGCVHGQGQAWWDANQLNNRPTGWKFGNINGGVIRDMKLFKGIAWNVNIVGSSNLQILNNTIHAISDTKSSASNTKQGFNVAGTNLLFDGNTVYNGDDCFAVGNGAKNIHIRNTLCVGGHGLSTGSLGAWAGASSLVENVLFENAVMVNSSYAARFKSWSDGSGLVKNITWRNVSYHRVQTPIFVTQNYVDNHKARAQAASRDDTRIQNMLFESFSGDIDDRYASFPNATGKEAIIFDLYPGTVTNIVANKIIATTDSGKPVAVMCNPKAVSNDVGFVCHNGAFKWTAAGY